MATYSKQFLSGSTNGRGVKVAATATAGTLIHTAHATDKDEIWLSAINDSASAVLLTIEFGGVTDPDDLITHSIPAQGEGLTVVVPGKVLSGGLAMRAFAASANVITLFGFVNRITS